MSNKPKRTGAIYRLAGKTTKPPFAQYNGPRGPGRYSRNKKRLQPLAVEDIATEAAQITSTALNTLWECKSTKDVGKWFRKGQRVFRRKVTKALARRKLSAGRKETALQLLTEPGATSNLALVSEDVCKSAAKELHRRLVRIFRAHPDWQCVFLTAISGDGGTSHTKTEIELFHSHRRFTKTLRAISPHFFGITELAVFNSQGHPEGGQMLQRHEHALVFGPDAVRQAGIIAAKHAERYPSNFTNAPVLKAKSVATDSVNLCRMAAYLFKAPSKAMNWNPPQDGKPGHMNQSEKGDRFTRYLRLAELRSHLTFDIATFGGGEGNRIQREMKQYLGSLSANAAAGGARILHPDAVASFWVELAKELGMKSWNLPIIKTSK